jgi:NADH:ubiquinone oxidoreductase subunit 2 (subunit N)
MAGVPPFIGFFSKLFILTLITNNAFTLLYTIFFVVLFVGLYFYIQNIRFIHSTNKGEIDHTYVNNNERLTPVFYYSSVTVLTLIIFGAVYVEDILLLFTWILL